MEKEFIPYEQALALKELRFNKPCLATFNPDKKLSRNPSHTMEDLPIEGQPYFWNNSKIHASCIAAPTWTSAFDWLLKTYNLYSISIPTINMAWTFKTMTVVEDMIEVPPYKHVEAADYSTIEEADLERLKKLIELVKEKRNEKSIFITNI